MKKLELSEKGIAYRRNLKLCLDWLFLGGELKVSSGHTLKMIENGSIGFKAIYSGDNYQTQQEMIMQIGSAEALVFLTQHANEMTDKDRLTLAGNLMLNET